MRVTADPHLSLPVSGAIAAYRRVILSAGVLALAGALDNDIGTTKQRVLASGLGSGSSAAVVEKKANGTVKMIASGAITQFAEVYGAADGKVSATSNGNYVGVAMTATTADGDDLEVLRLPRSYQKLYTAVASSAEHENTTDAALFDKSFSIPANTLKAGDVIHIVAHATVVDNNSTDTLTLTLNIGGLAGTVIATTGAVDVADGDIGYFEAWLTIRTIGATGTFVATGVQALGVPGTVTAKPFLKGSTTIDTTVAQVIGVSADWSVAHADNEVELTSLIIERIPA